MEEELYKQKEEILRCVICHAENVLYYGRKQKSIQDTVEPNIMEHNIVESNTMEHNIVESNTTEHNIVEHTTTEQKIEHKEKLEFPLFADGVYMKDKTPVVWRFPGGITAELSDMANHQTLYRTLVLLSTLTNNPKYWEAAAQEIEYYFEHYRDKSGLLKMGGHMFIDFATGEPIGKVDKMGLHELKNCFPFYEFMFAVNPQGTREYIEAIWNAHVLHWNTLEISRHGEYDLEKPVLFWENESKNYQKPEPFFETLGLSFMNAGNDLILSAGLLGHFTKDEKPLVWAKRLVGQYVSARDSKTGLGGYQFTQPKKRMEPTDDADTKSWFGDRAKRQLGPEFGDWVLEGRVIFPHQVECMYYKNALMQLYLAELLGEEEGKDFQTATLDGMRAFLQYEYDFADNTIRPMLSDGTDLTGYPMPRDGYYGKKGFAYQKEKADGRFLLSAFRAYQASGDMIFWEFAKNVAKFQGIGNLGSRLGEEMELNMQTDCSNSRVLIALTEMYRTSKEIAYLKLASVVAEHLLHERYQNGWFLHPDATHLCRFDEAEPFALLVYCAAVESVEEKKIPKFLDGEGYVQGAYEKADGTVENRNYVKNFYLL